MIATRVTAVTVLLSGCFIVSAESLRAGVAAPLFLDARQSHRSLRQELVIKASVALVFVSENTDCGAVTRTLPARELAVSEIVIAVVTPNGACAGAPATIRVLADRDGAIAEAYGFRHETGQFLGVLIDETGTVRRVIASTVETFARDVESWDLGRAIYTARCKHCHGSDGQSTSYQSIKTLGGIGRRVSEADIPSRIGRTGVVDLSGLTARELRAIAVYVAGL